MRSPRVSASGTRRRGDPVYYGEVRNVNRANMQAFGHYQCLALRVHQYEAGVIQYAHKMWGEVARRFLPL